MVLTLLKEACVTLKHKNCAFITKRINNLGHYIKPAHFKSVNHTADTISELKVLTTVTEPHPFLKLLKAFRRLFQDFARIPAPLSKQLKKTEKKRVEPLDEENI